MRAGTVLRSASWVLAGALVGVAVSTAVVVARSLYRAVVDEIDALELQDLDEFELEFQ